MLGRVEVLGREEVEERVGRAGSSPSKRRIHRSKSREEVRREVPGAEVLGEQAEEKEEEEGELGTEEVTMSTSHLMEFDNSVIKKKGKRSKNQKGQGIRRDMEGVEEEVGEEVEDERMRG